MAKQNIVAVTTKQVSEKARHVWIDLDACKSAVETFDVAIYDTNAWINHPLNPKPGISLTPEQTVSWIFIVDLLNFSFWSDVDNRDTGLAQTQRYAVEYNGVLYTGYWALAAAINRALEHGIAITEPQTWKTPNFAQLLGEVLKSSAEEQIPLFEERVKVLQEAATSDKSIFDLIEMAQGSALQLVQLLVETYKSFNDKCDYQGITVHFNKRAQILVADLWACFQGQSYGTFHDIDQLTMFADYRVPQILRSLNCIHYSDELSQHIADLKDIPHGHEWECEIRACSIQAVQEMVKYFKTQNPSTHINSILLDFYLWDTAKQKQQQGVDIGLCHRTRCIYY